MTAADVLMRKAMNQSILGAVEITELMMIGVVFCALAQCESDNGHIRIDFILQKASPRLRSALDALTQLLSGLLFCAMAWAVHRYAVNLRQWGEVTLDLGLPIHPFIFVACLGCGLLALVLLFKSVIALTDALKP